MRGYLKGKSEELLKNDLENALDMNKDHNGIVELLYFKYIMNTLRLIFTLFMFSYFGGIVWLQMCDIFRTYSWYWKKETNFIKEYKLWFRSEDLPAGEIQ